MGLIEDNLLRLRYFFDSDYPNRIQGRMHQETVLESRRLEGSVNIKKQAMERIDAYYDACAASQDGDLTKEQEDQAMTDRRILYLFLDWLPQQGYAGHLAASAAVQILFTEHEAGGVVYLEKLEELARRGDDLISVPASCARRAMKIVAKEAAGRGWRFHVAEDLRFKSKRHAARYDREADTREMYRNIRAKHAELSASEAGTDPEIRSMLEVEFDVSRSTVNRALRGEAPPLCSEVA